MLMTHRQERTPIQMIQIHGDNGQHLGWAAAVIDLAEPEMGGRDPRAPLTFSTLLVRGVLRIGHTFDLDDETEPIYYVAGRGIRPGTASYADLRCDHCVTHSTICYSSDRDTFLIMVHKRGCRWLTGVHREHGRAGDTPLNTAGAGRQNPAPA
jgi:hypothetical protein